MKMTPGDRRRLEYLLRIGDGLLECVHCGCYELTALTGGHIHDDSPPTPEELAFADTLEGEARGYLNSGGGNGTRGRKKSGRYAASWQFLAFLEKLGWPESHMRALQIECFNCNSGRRRSVFRKYSEQEIADAILEVEDGLAQGEKARTVI